MKACRGDGEYILFRIKFVDKVLPDAWGDDAIPYRIWRMGA